MSWIRYYCLVGVVVVCVLHQAVASGVFELRLKSFDNDAGKDDQGKCCTASTTTTTTTTTTSTSNASGASHGGCGGPCRPQFRVCLKEYRVNIDTTSPCTFGDATTKLSTADDQPQDGFDSPIRFSFPFTWPGSFSLIVEAWHGNLSSHSEVLITRLVRQTWLDVGENWTEDAQQSKYTQLRFEYRVTCDPYYYGRGCANLCRPRDDNFGHYTCSPTGDRVCLSGWTGDYCSTARCLPGCDEQHGHCTTPNECKCQLGWEGPLCNQCQRYPGCMHGTCVKSWDCLCNEGWGGLFCNQDLNFCTNHRPCRNGGTCFNTGQGSYTCSCPPGFTGSECEVALNDCARTPCLNGGTCIRNGTYHACLCPKGHQGPHCATPVQPCGERTCRNGGRCTETDAGYRCECASGYGGRNCETVDVVHYAASVCENGGTYVMGLSGAYACACLPGYTGDRCAINVDDCVDGPCLNGGTCVDKVNEFRCQCVPGFIGALCETRVDYCLTKPCANGGACIKLTNDYECRCAAGFTGKDCSLEVDECESHPCQNGGRCVNRVNGFECHCAAGFLGHVCDEAASSASPSARVSESNLSTEHVVVIATISTFIPLLVLVAVGVIVCLKQRRKREKARADEEARLQNEQNTAHSSFSKRGAAMATDAHMIKNSWGKCTNNVLSASNLPSPEECSISNISISENDCFPKQQQQLHQVIDGRPVYTLQRTRSQKQLNTEPGSRTSVLLAAKLHQHEPEYEHIKRLSVMSNSSAVCGVSDPSLFKRPMEKESSAGVYVIEPSTTFHRPDALSSAGLFATEV